MDVAQQKKLSQVCLTSRRRSTKIKNEQLDIALKSLLKLKFEFIEYKGSSKSKVKFAKIKNNIIVYFPHVSSKLSKGLHIITSNIDDTKINELIRLLDLELEGLKYNQDSSIVMINSSNIIDDLSYTFRAGFYTIFMSSTMTFISIIFIVVITLFGVALSSVESGWIKYFFIQMIYRFVSVKQRPPVFQRALLLCYLCS